MTGASAHQHVESMRVLRSDEDLFLLQVAQTLRDDKVRVKELVLQNGLTRNGAEALRSGLRLNTSLQKLKVCRLTSRETLDVLFQGVAESKSIKELALHGCRVLVPQDTRHLANLKCLSIQDCLLGTEGVASLVNALCNGTLRLEELRMIYCRLGASAATEIARMLETVTTVQVLDLSFNRIGDEGAKSLVDALLIKSNTNNNIRNTTLQKLIIDSCGIGNEGAFYLAGLLKMTNSLKELLVGRHFGFTEPQRQALLEGMSSNLSIVSVDMYTKPEFQEQIEQLVQMNRFRTTYLSQDRTRITPTHLPHILARVSDKPSALFLFLQENRDMLIPYLPAAEDLSNASYPSRKRKIPAGDLVLMHHNSSIDNNKPHPRQYRAIPRALASLPVSLHR
jgi:Ran GTPase-activating protein (RanGAP) involved in mRNA processing and transport